MRDYVPGYVKLSQTGELDTRIELLEERLKNCIIAFKGLLVRHLVMPENSPDTGIVLEFIANEVSKDTFINLMSQYYPAHKSYTFPELSRRISQTEYNKAVRFAEKLELENVMVT